MTSDIVDGPCRRCFEHVERVAIRYGERAVWWRVVCAGCGTKWICAVEFQRRPRRKAAA
jgi:hypothetical protein